jgi:hypothetical protein
LGIWRALKYLDSKKERQYRILGGLGCVTERSGKRPVIQDLVPLLLLFPLFKAHLDKAKLV